MSDATNLTGDRLEDLRASARRTGPFISPRAFRAVQDARFYDEWATAVLGRPYPGWNRIEPWEITLLADALAAEPNRPEPAAVRERREAYEREQAAQRALAVILEERERMIWHKLRDRLPVPVAVGHNWTIGHYDGHVTGKDHIVAQAPLRVGRLRRAHREALCETPAKRNRRLANGCDGDPLRALDRSDDGQDRIPTCAACLKVADRIVMRGGGGGRRMKKITIELEVPDDFDRIDADVVRYIAQEYIDEHHPPV